MCVNRPPCVDTSLRLICTVLVTTNPHPVTSELQHIHEGGIDAHLRRRSVSGLGE